MPTRYSISEDFKLWINRFESCSAAKVTEGWKCDVLLAALDDAFTGQFAEPVGRGP